MIWSDYKHLKIAEKIANEIMEKQEDLYHNFTDEELKHMTDTFMDRFQRGVSLNDLLVDVYAVAREVIFRVYELQLHKVQLMGAYILHTGNVAEMRTGEGKTITSILPSYLNSLSGNVIIVTVNDYLAKRDDEENGKFYNFMGVTHDVITKETPSNIKKEIYAKQITYITQSELGFDYLRDNMVANYEEKVQNGFNFVIVDEADSILIDEARTPLIISGGGVEKESLYKEANIFVKTLVEKEDLIRDKESRAIFLSPKGIEKVESFFKLENLYDAYNAELVHRIQNSIQANFVLRKDVEYAINDKKIELIDIFTGRILKGRSYSNGLQQAIQAKEYVEITFENITISTITIQNLFRMFKKISGMTGTSKTEEEEFLKIYNMYVLEIPTNVPIIRKDESDFIYATIEQKWNAIVEKIIEINKKEQPILVGTTSVENSELLSEKLEKRKIPHTVLNAKNHEREADIIASAGEKGAITIATNMAGRGTDIKLAEGVRETGGLLVIGTERHEARRIDLQLKGRSGRQGDPGRTFMMISLEDELLARSTSPRIKKFLENSSTDEALSSKLLTKSIDSAQKRIEGNNFDARKSVVEYDDVLSQQRLIIFNQRDKILQSEDLDAVYDRMFKRVGEEIITFDQYFDEGKFNVEKFITNISNSFFAKDKIDFDELKKMKHNEMANYLYEKMKNIHLNNTKAMLAPLKLKLEREILIRTIDSIWQKHLNKMLWLKTNINLRQMAQKNPIQLFIEETSTQFEQVTNDITHIAVLQVLNAIRNSEKQFEEASEQAKILNPNVAKKVKNYDANNSDDKEKKIKILTVD